MITEHQRHRRLQDGGHRADALFDSARPLRLEADEEAGAIDEIDDRQVKGLRHVDQRSMAACAAV